GRSGVGLDQRSLFTTAPDGSDEKRLPVSYTDCGEWSPDGVQMHVTASEYPGAPLRPAVVNADGSGFALFDTSAPSNLNLGCGDWSPAGARLVLEGFGGSSTVDGIYTVGAGDGRMPVTLGGRPYQPRWAPDGTVIVFGLGVNGQTDIYTVRPDGSGLTQLTDTPAVDEWWPDWGVG